MPIDATDGMIDTFFALAHDTRDGNDLRAAYRFSEFLADDPTPYRVAQLALTGAVANATALQDHLPDNADYYALDGHALDAQEVSADARTGMQLLVAVLNDDPELASDLLVAHHQAAGSLGLVGVIQVLCAIHNDLCPGGDQ